MKKALKYLSIIFAASIFGILAERNKEHLINGQYIRDHWHFRKEIENKSEILSSKEVMIFLAFGQSNAANYGNGNYVPKNEVYNYYKGNLYRAKEPLLGADGSGSSVWTRLADKIIDSGLYKKVIIVPCGIGSTSVECWSDGFCHEKLVNVLRDLKRDRVKLTHVFWQQGETDNVDGTTKIQYKQRLKKVIASIRQEQQPEVPFYCAISSYFPYNNDNLLGIDPEITTAQKEIIKEVPGVKPGPDTDSLNLAYYRADAVHFTEKGLDKLADEWYSKIYASINLQIK